MKVAINFCGGCDPAYDRVEVFQQIKSLAGASIEWLRVEEEGYQVVLLICGCPRACPSDELPHIAGLVSVTNNELSPAHVVDQLLRKGQTDADQDQR